MCCLILSTVLIKRNLICDSELMKESQSDQYKKYSLIEDIHDGSKQKFVACRIKDLAIF